ncbi:Crp/Fnr family transcriptional regulator [Saccharomonospora sp. NPDC046836]|uniref:Crp/Fnr family transcriptional regulator n=1 Tax=Saccharomonospora sp. NPDC046836 TaxID=3156921 RepID=UPI0033FB2487
MTGEKFVAGSFLSYLAEGDRDLLLGRGLRREFPANGTLLTEGDPSDHVLVVLSGWVRVATSLNDGREVVYALRGPGDVLGELAAVHGWPRSASVRGIGPVVAVQLTKSELFAALTNLPGIAVALLKTVAVRLRDAENARIGAAALDVSKRLAKYLIDLAGERGVVDGKEIFIESPLTQEDIAAHLGASRRAVARAFGLLRERGVVSTGRKRIVVHRLDVLKSLVRL